MAVAFADLAITSLMAFGLMAWFSCLPPVQVLVYRLFLLLALAAALGVGFWLSALTVRYRDVRFIVPFLVQFGLYVTPVGFSTTSVPSGYRALFALNPMVGVIEGFRWCLLGANGTSAAASCSVFCHRADPPCHGFRYFRATETDGSPTLFETGDMSDSVIRVEGLGKMYRSGPRGRMEGQHRAAPCHGGRALGGSASGCAGGRTRPRRPRTFWALKDVSFEVEAGRVRRHHRPQRRGQEHAAEDPQPHHRADRRARSSCDGRVGSLLEVGTGFHPELTGRENIFLNGAILGMSGREIDRKFDEIVAFAEVEKFLDTPVKRYSQRHVRAAGLRRGRPPGAGNPDRGRSAGGRRRGSSRRNASAR